MKNGMALIGSVGLGAGLMYLLDPERGTRRRAIARDKLTSAARKANGALGTTSRDLANRTKGVLAGARSAVRSEPAGDDVLVARVASKIGRVVSHPHALGITAWNGVVTLAGPVLAHEVDALLAAVAKVKGVLSIDNQLEVHKEPGNVPALQGGASRPGAPALDILQENWSPATRLLVSAAGGAMALYGASRGGLLGTTLGTAGVGLAARGITNTEVKRLAGLGGGRRGVQIQKTVNVDAPVEQVFDFWSNFENFPRFMSNVREVRPLEGGRSHWVVTGPAGVPVEWDAETTKVVPNEEIAWKSVEGSAIANAGVVKFRPNRRGGTEVDIRLSYNPPAGAVGHAVASLLGAHPKRQLDGDMLRLKTLFDTGKRAHDAAQPAPPGELQPIRQ